MTQFVNPKPPGQGIQWDALAERLLLIEVAGVENAIKTAFGESDAVRASVTVLDGDDAGTEHADTLIFPKVLITQLRSLTGQKVVARLGQGSAKSGQSPPWLLNAAEPADLTTAETYVRRRDTPAVSAPPF